MPDISEHIAHRLATTGWYVGKSIFAAGLSARLAQRAHGLADSHELHRARVGHNVGAQVNAQLRSDDTRWLEPAPDDASERDAMVPVNALRLHLNEALFLGAHEVELHFARYAPGAFYRTHRDRFRDDDARVLSLVCYLNADWPENAGGALRLHLDDGHHDIAPNMGTSVIFLSEEIEHEVLPAMQTRYSIAAWFRQREIQLR